MDDKQFHEWCDDLVGFIVGMQYTKPLAECVDFLEKKLLEKKFDLANYLIHKEYDQHSSKD